LQAQQAGPQALVVLTVQHAFEQMHHQLREFRDNGRAGLGTAFWIILVHVVHGSSLYPSQLAFNAQK
jgi:hypothetical protein